MHPMVLIRTGDDDDDDDALDTVQLPGWPLSDMSHTGVRFCTDKACNQT